MKKIAIRMIGALCLIAVLAVLAFPTWIQVDGISRKDMRTMRTQVTEDLENVETKMLYVLGAENIQEDLRENDLPKTIGRVKARFRETKDILRELLNESVSFKEVLTVAAEIPQYLEDTGNLLNTTEVAPYLFDISTLVYQEDVEQIIDVAVDYTFLASVLIGVFAAIVGLGVISAVTHCLNKMRFIKYIFIVVLVLLAVGTYIGMPMISEFIQEAFTLPEVAEGLELQATEMPCIAALLTLVPVVLDIVFERKKKETVEV